MDPNAPRPHPSNPLPNDAYPFDLSYQPSNLPPARTRPNRDAEEKQVTGGGPPSPYTDLPEVILTRPMSHAPPPPLVSSPHPSIMTPGPVSPPSLAHQPLLGSPGAGSSVVSPLSIAASPAPGISRPNKPPPPWGPDSLLALNPGLPPPPYNQPSSRPGTSHSVHSFHAAEPPSPSSSHISQTPLRPLGAAASGTGAYRPDMAAARPPAGHSPYPGGAAFGSSGDLGPVAKARKRRQRKLLFCICALSLLLVFLIALIVGIALGYIKVHAGSGSPPPRNGS